MNYLSEPPSFLFEATALRRSMGVASLGVAMKRDELALPSVVELSLLSAGEGVSGTGGGREVIGVRG